MHLHHFVASVVALAPMAFAGNPSSVYLNEIYASHTGTDTLEMIELVGQPNASLTGYVVCVVEGDGTGAGTLDRAWNLSGLTIPADGYFVLGDTAEPNLDLDIGASNRLENGTETFYLLHTATPALVTALLDTDVDAGDGNTFLATLGDIVDRVAMVDPGWIDGGDEIYDDATIVGPDGSNFPAGIYRSGDHPGKWSTNYLDFDGVANTTQPRTPGAPNGTHSIRTYGSPQCTSASGRMKFSVDGDTTAGTGSITIGVSNGPKNGGLGGAPAVLFIGVGETNVTFGGGGCQFLVQSPLNFFPILDASGSFLTSPVPIPAGATGAKAYMQVISFESGDFVESNGIELEIL